MYNKQDTTNQFHTFKSHLKDYVIKFMFIVVPETIRSESDIFGIPSVAQVMFKSLRMPTGLT